MMQIGESRKFDIFILVIIIVSSILLAIESPLDNPTSVKTAVLLYFDIAITVIFTTEVLIKVIARGWLLCGP